jgi:hypothetical protein
LSRQRESEAPLVMPANCFATRYGRSRIRIQSRTMQLGLRFAAAKLPELRAGRGGQEPRGARRTGEVPRYRSAPDPSGLPTRERSSGTSKSTASCSALNSAGIGSCRLQKTASIKNRSRIETPEATVVEQAARVETQTPVVGPPRIASQIATVVSRSQNRFQQSVEAPNLSRDPRTRKNTLPLTHLMERLLNPSLTAASLHVN